MHEVLLFAYAQLIADAAISCRSSHAPAMRTGSRYWSFANSTFLKLKAGLISPSTVLRENKLLVSNGMECAYCGDTTKLQWEHIVPCSRRGPNTIDNLVLSCARCNSQKGALNPIEWYEARGLRKADVPRLVMGKLIKLVCEEHSRRDSLNAPEFPVGCGLTLAGACLVFDFPDSGGTATPGWSS
ncbi:MAG: HNH endonuclease [Xanthomonadales bacterium]|nr:HNH endonuclease [Xanthomonadales bacterium]